MKETLCSQVGFYRVCMVYVSFYRKAPRLKSEGDTRKSRRSISAQGGHGDQSGSPLAIRREPVVEEEPEPPTRVSKQMYEPQAKQASPEPDSTMSYLEKRRAERA